MKDVCCRDCENARFHKENGIPYATRTCFNNPVTEEIRHTPMYTFPRDCREFKWRQKK